MFKERIYIIYWLESKICGNKKSLLINGQEAIQMFSQRNNPYCEFLSMTIVIENFFKMKYKMLIFCLH